MVENLKKVTLCYEPFSEGEVDVLRVILKVSRVVPYVSSVWPSRVILWLSRRYHVISSYFAIQNSDSFILTSLIICDKDYFRCWSHKALLGYVRSLIK